MRVQLLLYASLAKFLPPEGSGNSSALEVEDGASIGDLLALVKVPEDSPRIIFVNGRHAQLSQELADGDRVAVFPPIAGG